MKSKRISTYFIFTFAALMLTLPGMAAAESNVGHISFIENEGSVTRADQAENRLVVNLPIVPGDTVVTSDNGRCELQFDNGTVIRLDKNSRLRITTVQAPTLSSLWKVTTLDLLHGQVYALPQTYRMEMFQIITPNAAVKLKSRTAATIGFDTDLSTTLFSDAGKFEVLYGADSKTVKKVKVKSGQSYTIDAAHTLAISSEKRNLEFVAWNEYVDRHFKELHFGISKVPPKLKFGNSALVYWAEKWSSLVGEWIYDDLFGYVWKPADERFANSARPFFNADYVRINGRLFLVPQEAWGWVPANMGTWVWLNRGWTWVPGKWFRFHSQANGVSDFFDNYFLDVYGDFDLYYIYREQGNRVWRENYYRKFHKLHKKPPVKYLPRELQIIIKRINKAPLTVVAERLKASRASSALGAKKILAPIVSPKIDLFEKGAKSVSPAAGKGVLSKSLAPDPFASVKGKAKANDELKNLGGRDWNPDRRWAKEQGCSINYSSSRNAVICPELKISSEHGPLNNRVDSAGSVLSAPGYLPENSSPSDTNSTRANTSATSERAVNTTTTSDENHKSE